MGREARMVPKDWKHPRDAKGNFIPLYGGSFKKDLAEWEEANEKWSQGLRENWADKSWVPIEEEYNDMSFEEWGGERPEEKDYMPDWPAEQRTHYQMYETCTEGTPISEPMDTPEELARWLYETGASAFGDSTASYEAWLSVCRGGFAPSAVVENGKLKPGVEFAYETEQGRQ